jgi:hypothetical protein
MPMDRKLYPKNWEEIALAVKSESNWTCEQCGKICRRSKEKLAAFCKRTNEWKEVARRPQSFTLTCAHYPDRDPDNCARENLIALCAPCHLKIDSRQHAQSRVTNQFKEKEAGGQLNVFNL